MKDYRKDYANNDDNYPKTVRGMVDVMRQLKPKPKKDDKNNKNKRNGDGNNKDGSNKESSFATTSAKCWCCGKPGCISKNCKIADDIPRNKWYDRSGIVHYTEADQESEPAEARLQESSCRGS